MLFWVALLCFLTREWLRIEALIIESPSPILRKLAIVCNKLDWLKQQNGTSSIHLNQSDLREAFCAKCPHQIGEDPVSLSCCQGQVSGRYDRGALDPGEGQCQDDAASSPTLCLNIRTTKKCILKASF